MSGRRLPCRFCRCRQWPVTTGFRTRVRNHRQFEHVEKQFHALDDRLRDIASETAVIHRRVERLEELGASNAGFAKEIDHLLTRVAAIEEHLKINKKIAA